VLAAAKPAAYVTLMANNRAKQWMLFLTATFSMINPTFVKLGEFGGSRGENRVQFKKRSALSSWFNSKPGVGAQAFVLCLFPSGFCVGNSVLDYTVTNDPSTLNDRIEAIFARLFRANPAKLGDHVRRGELQRWDSLGHLELLAALEKEFQIEIPVDEVLAMETIGDVKRTVEKRCRTNPLPPQPNAG
jgi:acyl carrier protein